MPDELRFKAKGTDFTWFQSQTAQSYYHAQ